MMLVGKEFGSTPGAPLSGTDPEETSSMLTMESIR